MSFTGLRPETIIPSVFGIHPLTHYPQETQPNFFKIAHNVTNILDWIPGISMITGVARLAFLAFVLCKHGDNIQEYDREYLFYEGLRGVAALLNVGWLLMPSDIIFSFHYANCDG